MKQILVFSFVLITAISVFGQTKTVTNFDLEKYKEQRLAAERDYRENYERLGFPSPEELERRNAESRRELSEYSARLRQERLTEEYAAAIQAQSSNAASAPEVYRQNTRTVYFGGAFPYGFYNYGNYGNSGYNSPTRNRFPNSDYIDRLRQTDFINRRNGYNSPFQPQSNPRSNFPVRGGKRN